MTDDGARTGNGAPRTVLRGLVDTRWFQFVALAVFLAAVAIDVPPLFSSGNAEIAVGGQLVALGVLLSGAVWFLMIVAGWSIAAGGASLMGTALVLGGGLWFGAALHDEPWATLGKVVAILFLLLFSLGGISNELRRETVYSEKASDDHPRAGDRPTSR